MKNRDQNPPQQDRANSGKLLKPENTKCSKCRDLERAGISSVEYINNFSAGKCRFTFADFALGYLHSYFNPFLTYGVMGP
jgi:hypothetical protein